MLLCHLGDFMAFIKILELNIKMQRKLENRIEYLENYYAAGRSSFVLKEILEISKELLKLKIEEQEINILFNKFAKVKKI